MEAVPQSSSIGAEIRGQDLSHRQYCDFAERFGPLRAINLASVVPRADDFGFGARIS